MLLVSPNGAPVKNCFVASIIACSLLLVPGNEGKAQTGPSGAVEISIVDSSRIQVIKLGDGSTLIGRVVRVDADSVEIETKGARATLSRTAIRSIVVRPATAIKNGEYWVQNPNTSRLLFGPTGQMLKRGEGYVADFELVFLGGAYGLTDNFTMGGGFLLPAPGTAYFLTPKLGFSPSPKVHVATGAMLIGLTGESESIGVYYGVTTLGDEDRSVTGGIGYGFSGADVASEPVFMFGGEKRFSSRIALVTENYFVPGTSPLIGAGVRFIGEKLSADLGVMQLGGSGDSNIIPLINFMAKF